MATCDGSAHVIPVPPGMTADQAWAEITTLGKLALYQGEPTWAVVECPGGAACDCRGAEKARSYRRRVNDRLVEARIFGLRVPHPLLGVLARCWR